MWQVVSVQQMASGVTKLHQWLQSCSQGNMACVQVILACVYICTCTSMCPMALVCTYTLLTSGKLLLKSKEHRLCLGPSWGCRRLFWDRELMTPSPVCSLPFTHPAGFGISWCSLTNSHPQAFRKSQEGVRRCFLKALELEQHLTTCVGSSWRSVAFASVLLSQTSVQLGFLGTMPPWPQHSY